MMLRRITPFLTMLVVTIPEYNHPKNVTATLIEASTTT